MIKLNDKESYTSLLKEFPNCANEIEDSVTFFMRADPMTDVDKACELTRSSIYLSMAGIMF